VQLKYLKQFAVDNKCNADIEAIVSGAATITWEKTAE
jgi:hypothetical protein